MQTSPVEHQRSTGIGLEITRLLAVVVGEELKPFLCDPLTQHHPSIGLALSDGLGVTKDDQNSTNWLAVASVMALGSTSLPQSMASLSHLLKKGKGSLCARISSSVNSKSSYDTRMS